LKSFFPSSWNIDLLLSFATSWFNDEVFARFRGHRELTLPMLGAQFDSNVEWFTDFAYITTSSGALGTVSVGPGLSSSTLAAKSLGLET